MRSNSVYESEEERSFQFANEPQCESYSDKVLDDRDSRLRLDSIDALTGHYRPYHEAFFGFELAYHHYTHALWTALRFYECIRDDSRLSMVLKTILKSEVGAYMLHRASTCFKIVPSTLTFGAHDARLLHGNNMW